MKRYQIPISVLERQGCRTHQSDRRLIKIELLFIVDDMLSTLFQYN